MVTLSQVKENPYIHEYILRTDQNMQAIGYTEHGFRHAELVSTIARNVAEKLGLSKHDQELAAIAAYCHDMGNFINRLDHYAWSATLVHPVLLSLKMPPTDVVTIMNAIYAHDQPSSVIFNPISAIVILADKSDVHRSRVPAKDITPSMLKNDIHTRANYAVTRSFLRVEMEIKEIVLELDIDTAVTPLMEYFEAFIDRMTHCRKAAEYVGLRFALVMNGHKVL